MADEIPTQELIQLLAQRLAALKQRQALLQAEVASKTALLCPPVVAAAAAASEEQELYGEDEDLCKDLFSEKRLLPSQVIASLLSEHGFDLVAFCKKLSRGNSDHLAMARTVNYIRSRVGAAGQTSPQQILAQVQSNANNWQQDDAFLKPVLENDGLLYADSFSDDEDFDGESVAEDDVESSSSDDDEEEDDASSQSSVDSYFGGYDSIDIHEEMLHDEIRTLAYRDSFVNSKDVLEAQTVIDVGSGTGILSMLISKHGAAKEVHAIENCRTLSKLSRKLMNRNGFNQDKIKLFVGLAQDFAVKNPGVKANAVVSEWMGYALLYEHQMLSAVFKVRDATLAQGGRMFPNKGRLLLHAIGDNDERLNYWDSVYGFDFSLMKELRRQRVDVSVVNPNALLSPVAVFKEFDFETMLDAELDFEAPFEVVVRSDQTVVEGLCISFDCSFPADAPGQASLTTSPEHPATHWKQSVLWLDQPLLLAGEDKAIRGSISYIRKGAKLDIGLRITHPIQALSIYEM